MGPGRNAYPTPHRFRWLRPDSREVLLHKQLALLLSAVAYKQTNNCVHRSGGSCRVRYRGTHRSLYSLNPRNSCRLRFQRPDHSGQANNPSLVNRSVMSERKHGDQSPLQATGESRTIQTLRNKLQARWLYPYQRGVFLHSGCSMQHWQVEWNDITE